MSFQRHNKIICAEYKKSVPNKSVVDELASLSFAMRRADILDVKSVMEVFIKYPFLREEDEVIPLF